jgi:putative MFS transporter
VLTLGLFADMAEVALGNALAAVFQSPTDPPDIAVFTAAIFTGGAVAAPLVGLLGDHAASTFLANHDVRSGM